mgnify:CR=1 FL=1
MRIKFFFAILLLGLSMVPAWATHIAGVDVRYECLSPCTYRFYQTVYYDCSGTLMTASGHVPINGFNFPIDEWGGGSLADGFRFQLTSTCVAYPMADSSHWHPLSYSDATPVCPGVGTSCTDTASTIRGIAEAVQYMDVNMCISGCDTIRAIWESCCRNGAITSLDQPSSQGFFLDAMDIILDSGACNNHAPVFNGSAHTTICAGAPTVLDMSAYDADGDSLVYSLTTGYDAQGIPLPYLPGYSPQQPMGPTWHVQLDPQTGLLSLTPQPIGSFEVGVIVIQIDEYRNGQLLSSYKRDFQLEVTMCSANQSPVIQDPVLLSGSPTFSHDTLYVCPGLTYTWSIPLSDPDTSQSVSGYLAGASALGASVNLIPGNPAQLEITWTADSLPNGVNVFPYTVAAEDDHCPLNAQTYRVFFLSVGTNCVAVDITPSDCPGSNGAIDLTMSVGTAPYSYLWNTGDTTEDLSGLGAGFYWAWITDSAGLTFFSDTIFVPGSGFDLSSTVQQPICGQPTGSVYVSPLGGTGPYTYAWSHGGSGDSLGGLPPGGYSVVATDANGCPAQAVVELTEPDSCFVSVTGTLFADLNGNCVQDPGETGLPYVYLDYGSGATFTDLNGHYALQLDIGSYLLTPDSSGYLSYPCLSGGQMPLTFTSLQQDTSGVDIPAQFVAVQDLRIYQTLTPVAAPGITHLNTITYQNAGSLLMDGDVNWLHDGLVAPLARVPQSFVYQTGTSTTTWEVASLLPGEIRNAFAYAVVDTTANIGDSICSTVWVNPIIGDTTPGDNADTACYPVQASYDPNDKQVAPAGFGLQGFIQAHEQEMVYTIRFQNTGTFPASVVEIHDEIDSDLTISSFEHRTSSHPYTLRVENGHRLVFRFDGINLPDSTSNPLGSIGHVSFSLRHRDTLPIGTEITNQAAIYFDYNPPIMTNEVLNTIFAYPAVVLSDSAVDCEGDPLVGAVTSPGMPPYTYAWSDGSQQTQAGAVASIPVSNGSQWYALTVTDAFGFSTQDSLWVSTDPLPVTDFVFAQGHGLTVDFADLSQYGDGNRHWDLGTGYTTGDSAFSYTFPGAGTYRVALTAQNACGQDALSQLITVGTTDLSAPDGLAWTLFPHPLAERSILRFANPGRAAYRLRLLDARGRVLRHYSPTRGETFVIDRRGLPDGIYLLELVGPQTVHTKLLVR